MVSKLLFYRQFYEQAHRWQSMRPSEEFAGRYLNIPQDVNSILDVGCGSGRFLESLAGRYEEVGIDICFEPLVRIRAARAVASCDGLPFRCLSFDLVTCLEVLEHLPDPLFPKALAELERVSRRYIAVSVPDCEILAQSLVTCSRCCCAFNPSGHVRSFDKASMESLFARFRLVQCQACGPLIYSHNSKLVKLYRAMVPREPPPCAVCPQCGYSVTPDEETARTDWRGRPEPSDHKAFIRIVGDHAKRVLVRQEQHPYWLMALYECA